MGGSLCTFAPYRVTVHFMTVNHGFVADYNIFSHAKMHFYFLAISLQQQGQSLRQILSGLAAVKHLYLVEAKSKLENAHITGMPTRIQRTLQFMQLCAAGRLPVQRVGDPRGRRAGVRGGGGAGLHQRYAQERGRRGAVGGVLQQRHLPPAAAGVGGDAVSQNGAARGRVQGRGDDRGGG